MKNSQESKPLFVPLKTEFYEAFRVGKKTEELRKYGARWNRNTCKVNRTVILSKGYGRQNRMIGRISAFRKQRGSLFCVEDRVDIKAIYGTTDVDIACISVTGLRPVLENISKNQRR